MAARKGSRSSKTDHVLNLLSHPVAPEQPAVDETSAIQQDVTPKEAATSAQTAKSAPAEPAQERRLTPPILEVARSNNEALEETIHSALEAALQDGLEDSQTPSEPAPAALAEETAPDADDVAPVEKTASERTESAAPAKETSVKLEVPVSDVSAAEATPAAEAKLEASENTAQAAEAAPQETPAAPKPAPAAAPTDADKLLPPDDARFANVMEQLVGEKLEKYVKLFHLCNCPRCLADARALALSRLPAKYVVLSSTAYRPMMSYYEAKFDSAVTTQIVYACKQVLEAPRHGPKP